MLEYILGNENALTMISRVIVLLICFPVHECAHAWMADRLGDGTGRARGRITLNPLKHLDFMGTVFIIVLGFGYAKPVPVNINNFRNKKRDFALTALAGPVSNLLMAVLFLFIVRLIPGLRSPAGYGALGFYLLVNAAYINISLAVFNLLPIPPLDGSRVLTALLPDGAYDAMLKKERYIMSLLLIAMAALGRMGYSPIGVITSNVFRFLSRIIITGP